MNKEGFAMIIVLLCLSALFLISIITYRSSSLLIDFAREHGEHQKNEALLDGALVYALEFYRENEQKLAFYTKKGQQKETITIPLYGKNNMALITIILGKKEQSIEISLLENNMIKATKHFSIDN